MTSPAESLSVETLYQDAQTFWAEYERVQGNELAIEKLRVILSRLNGNCSLRNTEMRIESPIHHIDWSCGELGERIPLEEVEGTFGGLFIGYLVLPTAVGLNSVTEMPTLSTTLKTTIYHEEIDYYSDVAVITPIPTASIQLM